MLSIEKHLIIGLVFYTTSMNTGVHKGVAVSLERAFGGKLLQLACRHHVLELLCRAAASTVFGKTKSPNEAAFEILLDRWPVLDKVEYQVKKVICRNEKVQHKSVISFCLATLCDDICRKDYEKVLELTVVYLSKYSIWLVYHLFIILL